MKEIYEVYSFNTNTTLFIERRQIKEKHLLKYGVFQRQNKFG